VSFVSKKRNDRNRGEKKEGSENGRKEKKVDEKSENGKEEKRKEKGRRKPKFTFLATTLHARFEQGCQLAKAVSDFVQIHP